MSIDYFEGHEAKPAKTVEEIAALCDDAAKLEAQIEEAATKTKELEAQLDRLLRVTIPEAMGDLASITLRDGRKVEPKTDIKTSISEANKPAAFDWLEKNGFGGIIKSDVKIAFTKDEIEVANTLIDELHEKGYDANLNRSVHAATLKSFVKEQLEAGTNIPVAEFGIFEFKTTKITKAKGRK